MTNGITFVAYEVAACEKPDKLPVKSSESQEIGIQ